MIVDQERGRGVPTATGTGSRAPRRAVVAIAAGLVALLIGSVWTGFGAHLATTLLTSASTSRTGAPSPTWAVMTALVAGGLMMMTGPRAWVRSVDPVAVVGVVWTLGWTAAVAAFVSSLEFADPDRRCRYAGCWPAGYQDLAVAGPLLAACLMMLVMATVGRACSWTVRSLVPAATYVGLVVVQLAVWNRLAVPLFASAPPT